MDAEHVLKRTSDEKELLLETQPFALLGFVIRIEDLGDVFGVHLRLHSLHVITLVEGCEIKRLDRFRLPKAQCIAGTDPITGNRRIVSDTLHDLVWNPADSIAALFVGPRLGAST